MQRKWQLATQARPAILLALEKNWRCQGTRAAATAAASARTQAERTPDRILYTAGAAGLTCADVCNDAEALAASLWELGLRSGEVISFQIPNWTEAAVIDLAACMLGLVCNPIAPIYRDAEVAMMLADCQSRAIFIPGDAHGYDFAAMLRRLQPGLPALRHVISVRGSDAQMPGCAELVAAGRGRAVPEVRLDAHAMKLIMYTSGTTGRAKGVLHSHETLATLTEICMRAWGLAAGAVMLMPSPVTHITGYTCGLEMPLLHGTRTVLMERWNADAAVTLVDHEGVNATVGATPFLKELVAAAMASGSRLPALRVFACGGAAVPPDLIRTANESLAGRTFRVYGSTEAPLVAAAPADMNDIGQCAETDGRVCDYDIKIVDDSDRTLPAGDEGEILVRGPALFPGYADPQQTRDAFDAEGYFRTGDLGRLTDRNALIITGRKKDLIIRGGEKISAKELEDVIHRHPSVQEVAVIAVPHARLGETACACVIPKPGRIVTLADVTAMVQAAGLAKQKYPERMEILDAFPRTASGKIRKDELRRRFAAARGA